MPLKQSYGHTSRRRPVSAYEAEDGEQNEIEYNDKMKIECICPKCGQRHIMTFHWIGRGTPRKYCPVCKLNN